jgi:Zn-dependent protease/uncharacterized Zn finger protein (UPF0148 family)
VSTITPSLVQQCPNCSQDLQPGTVACPVCHTLVHAVELDALAREARALEAAKKIVEAREIWNRSLAMLPPDSKQAEWVRGRMGFLEKAQAAAAENERPSNHAWARRLGPLGPIAIVLAKSKGALLAIFKLKFLFSFFSFVAFYVTFFGWRYGLGIAVSVLIHEMGHYVDIKRRGLPAEMPVFIPGIAAYVRWDAMGVTLRQRAQVSLAGPLAGWIAAACCFVFYSQTHDPLWAALARTGAVLNLLNLIPVPFLDGGQAVNALGQVERAALLTVALALWLFTGEGIFFLVSAGVAWRLFTKDKPAQDDWSSWAYYAAVLIALGVVLHASPAMLGNGAMR